MSTVRHLDPQNFDKLEKSGSQSKPNCDIVAAFAPTSNEFCVEKPTTYGPKAAVQIYLVCHTFWRSSFSSKTCVLSIRVALPPCVARSNDVTMAAFFWISKVIPRRPHLHGRRNRRKRRPHLRASFSVARPPCLPLCGLNTAGEQPMPCQTCQSRHAGLLI